MIWAAKRCAKARTSSGNVDSSIERCPRTNSSMRWASAGQ
jgi:hypothetical protein